MDSELYKDLIGLPYRSKADGPDAYDCFGVIKEVYRRCGVILPDVICTDDFVDLDRAIVVETAKYTQVDSPQVGAVIAFRTIGKLVTHVGLVLDHCRMLHSSDKTNVCITRFDSTIWKQRIEGYYVFK